jgi:hypothetical protein
MRKLEGPEAGYIKTSLRLPPKLRDEIVETGAAHGRGMNAEILERLTATPIHDRLDKLEQELALMKSILIEIRDK